MFSENGSSFICQRTIHIDLKIIMSSNKAFLLDLPDKIQHFLRSAYCKRRNHQITASVKGFLDHLCQKLYIFRTFSMTSVSICGFHHHIICFLKICWILDQWLVFIANISGKYYFFFFSIFFHPDLNTGRTKQMSCICKTNLYPGSRLENFSILSSHKILQHCQCIFHGIYRHKICFSLAASLTIAPFCLKHLDMCTITKHNITQMTGGFCCIDRSLKAFCI